MNREKKYKLTIELMSDLCVGSGFSYAGVIDSDTCFDKYGIPYIPAKRLKGCFRENAKNLLGYSEKECNEIFGERGAQEASKLKFSNAYLKDYEKIKGTVIDFNQECNINNEWIKEEFATVKAQTAMEEGIAKEDSLRFTRVVNKMTSDGRNTVFEAEIRCEEDLFEKIETIVRATKNIGMNRNRGLGSIKCSLEELTEEKNMDYTGVLEEEESYAIEFEIENVQPIVMSKSSENKTESYISGTSFKGCIASKYLKMDGKTEGEEFNEIFLGETIFDNIYPGNLNQKYYPAPLFLRTLKKTKDLIVMSDLQGANKPEIREKIQADPGNRPKKISSDYVWVKGEKDKYLFDVIETEFQNVYHNSNIKDNSMRMLYMLEVIPAGTRFHGRIIVRGKFVKILYSLLMNGYLTFGKSKSSQYGDCKVVDINVSKYTVEKVRAKNIMITLNSDFILKNKEGNYSVKREDAAQTVKQKLATMTGISLEDVQVNFSQESEPVSFIETRMLYGYNAMWNLKKCSIPAIKAGSCISITLPESIELPRELYLGEFNSEGNGLAVVYDNDKLTYLCERLKVQEKEKRQEKDLPWLRENIQFKLVGEELKNTVFVNPINVNASTLGRITLMLRESQQEKGYLDFENDLKERIRSIKRDKTKKEAERFIKNSNEKFESILHEAEEKYHASISGLDKEKLRYEYLMNLLVYKKYNLKNE